MEPKLLGEQIREKRNARGWSQEKLAEAAGISQSAVQRIEGGQFKRLGEALARVGHTLGVPTQPGLQIQVDSRPILEQSGPAARIPVMGMAEGGKGVLIIDGEPIDYVEPPAELAGVKDAYAVRVTGNSMVPAFRPGDIALVHPYITPIANDDVVLQSDRQGTREGLVKTFLSASQSEWKLQEWYPRQRIFTRSRLEWPVCHVIIGKYRKR